MASGKLDIANRALAHSKADPIPDLATLTTSSLNEAIQVNIHIDSSKREVLRQHPWNRAMTDEALDVHPVAPLTRYAYKYRLPGDCIRVVSLNELDPANETAHYWRIKGDRDGVYLHTDETSAIIEYVFDQEFGRLDDLCTSMIEFLLASKICFPLTGSRTRAKDMLDVYNGMVRNLAKSVDAMEEHAKPVNRRKYSKWRRSRYASTNG